MYQGIYLSVQLFFVPDTTFAVEVIRLRQSSHFDRSGHTTQALKESLKIGREIRIHRPQQYRVRACRPDRVLQQRTENTEIRCRIGSENSAAKMKIGNDEANIRTGRDFIRVARVMNPATRYTVTVEYVREAGQVGQCIVDNDDPW